MGIHSKNADGKYHIKGKTFELLIGTRAQVWHETAYKTSGGLRTMDLVQNDKGRIVSKSKYLTAKKEKRLLKHGYGTQKGKFGAVRVAVKSKKIQKSRKTGGAILLGGDTTMDLSVNTQKATAAQEAQEAPKTQVETVETEATSASNAPETPVIEANKGGAILLGGKKRGGAILLGGKTRKTGGAILL